MTELTGNMPATALTPSAGLGTVAKQVALNLEALQRLTQDFQAALTASVGDRGDLHTAVDSITTRLVSLEAKRPRVAPTTTVPAMLTLVGSAASVDVALTWGASWPEGASYEVVPILEVTSTVAGKQTAAVKSKSATGCVVTVTTTAVLAGSTATLRALSVSST